MFLIKRNSIFFGGIFLILCFALNFFQILFPTQFETSTLVYCPLQKTWVKRDEPNKQEAENSLDYLCASDKQKNLLRFKISLKTLQPVTEKNFFDYLEKGDRLFTGLNQFPDLPHRKLFNQSKSEIAINNFNYKIEKTEFGQFSFAQHQRPPSKSVSVCFDFQISRDLEKISRNINPRSPPFFI